MTRRKPSVASGSAAWFLLILAVNALLCSPAIAQTHEVGSVRESAGAPLFDPDHQRPVSQKNGSLALQLQKSGDSLAVAIFSQGTLASKVQLPDLMTQVDEIRFINAGRAVVLGWSNGSVNAAAVLDLSTGTIADSFRMYAPKLSPDGRYIAFVKFFSSHFARNPTDDYLLYDLTQDARANRSSGVDLDDTSTVGTPVFPRDFKNMAADNVGAAVRDQHMMASDNFYWTAGARRFVFADQSASDRKSGRLTIVGVNVEGNSVSSQSITVPVPGLCAAGQPECLLRASQFRFKGNSVTFEAASLTDSGVPPQEVHFKWSDLK